MSEKIYCGQGKSRETQFGTAFDVMLFDDDVDTIQQRLEEVKAKGNNAVKLSFMKKRDESKAWNYYGQVDTWEPEKQDAHNSRVESNW